MFPMLKNPLSGAVPVSILTIPRPRPRPNTWLAFEAWFLVPVRVTCKPVCR